MRKIILTLFLSFSFLSSEPFSTQMVNQSLTNGAKGLLNSVKSNVKYLTHTQTKKEKCNQAWWDYFKSSSETISTLDAENRDIKKLLRKHNIGYSSFVRIATRNINIDIGEIREKSCSKSYFEQKVQKDKRIKTLYAENRELNRLLHDNGLKLERVVFYKPKKKRIRKKTITYVKVKSKEKKERELLRAMKDVN